MLPFYRVKMGIFVGGAGLEAISEELGKAAVAKLELTKPGTNSD